MEIRLSKKTLVISVLVAGSFLLIALFGKPAISTLPSGQDTKASAIIKVKAGYLPREVVLPANMQNTLRFVTNNTYDCSASLYIRELNIEKFLPPTGETDIVIPAQPVGKEIIAGCSMGMYGFKLKFQ